MAISPLYIGCSHDVLYSGATAALTGLPLNLGTCTYTLTDPNGLVVGTGSLTYVTASVGNYVGNISATITANLTADNFYLLTIFFAQGGYKDEREIQLLCAFRAQ